MSQNFNLPIAIDIEEAVLGSVLLETRAMPLAIKHLRAEMFHRESHQLIFATLVRMFGEGQAIDILTVTYELKRIDKLEAVGGPHYITWLSSQVASSAHLEQHACLLRDYYMRRELIKGLSRTLAMATDMTIYTEDVMCAMQDVIDGIGKDAMWTNTLQSMEQVMEVALKQASERRATTKDGITGIPTGITQLNHITSGWQPGNLYTMAGRPGTGKTMIALHSALAAAKAGFKVLFCSIEMPASRLGDRCLLLESDIDSKGWRKGTTSTPEWIEAQNMAGKLKQLSLMIDDNSSMSIDYIRAEARMLKSQGKCDIVFVDYLQLSDMRSADSKWQQNRQQDVADAARKSKLMAKELDCPVVILSQLNRELEQRQTKRPQLADLRESGAIEQDSDVVIMLYRPAMYGIPTDQESGLPTEGLGMAIVTKQRDGETGTAYFGHNATLTKIGDYLPPMEWLIKQQEKREKAKAEREKAERAATEKAAAEKAAREQKNLFQ